ncbi:MAG: zinc ribbon domain-containing protein [Dehalococcoidales bacterium]|nr:MAG: zinc ribbon domain-containing protein [Dehalococcoidales bacterium]
MTFDDIPSEILSGLLDLAGDASDMSPRHLMADPTSVDAYQLAELYAGGFIELPEKSTLRLSENFTRVASVLLNPVTNVTIRAWGVDNNYAETNIQFRGTIAEGNGVILNQIGGYYRITAPVYEDDITTLLGSFIPGSLEEEIDFEFESHLGTVDAAILLAALDLARNQFNEQDDRSVDITQFNFKAQDLIDYLTERWSLTGFKDLITYAAAAGMMPEQPSLSETVDALRNLVKAGALQEPEKDNFTITMVLEPLVSLTLDLQSGIQWQKVARIGEDELLWSSRIYLFGDRSLILCLAPTLEGRIFISRVNKQDMIDFFLDEMTVILVPETDQVTEEEPEETPVFAIVTCENCGRELKPGAQFCPDCGTQIAVLKEVPQDGVCPDCGTQLKPNARFCPNCGKQIDKEKPKSEKRVCAYCGKELKTNAKYCPECGTPV